MKIDKKKPSHWLALIKFFFVASTALIKRKVLPKPTNQKSVIILYGHKLNSNLHALYEELEKHSNIFDFFFLTMDELYFRSLNLKNIKCLNACKVDSIDILSRMDIVVSDHGLHCLSIFIGRTEVKFVDLWHGLPFKGFTPNDFKSLHQYDAVCVSSEILKQVYINEFGFKKDKIFVTGYGRTDLLLHSQPTKQTYDDIGLPVGANIILFAPTWSHKALNGLRYPFNLEDYTFVNKFEKICTRLNAFLIVRSHLNQTSAVRNNVNTRVIFRPHSMYPDTEQLLSVTSMLITDWSSISLDFLPLKRPIIYIESTPPFDKTSSLVGYRFGLKVNSFNALEKTVSDYIRNEVAYQKKYKEGINRAIEDLYGNSIYEKSAPQYVKVIMNLLKQ